MARRCIFDGIIGASCELILSEKMVCYFLFIAFSFSNLYLHGRHAVARI